MRPLQTVARILLPQARVRTEGALRALQTAGAEVVVANTRPKPISFTPVWTENQLPRSVDMLATNNIPVQPSLLLRALPWDILTTTPFSSLGAAAITAEIRRRFDELQRWRDMGYLVNPQLAIDICQQASTWLAVREIERTMGATDAFGVVREVLRTNKIETAKLAARHEKILQLLEEGKTSEAFTHAQATLRSLESTHNLLESTYQRALDAQHNAGRLKSMLFQSVGLCVVLGLACEFVACVSEGALSNVLPVIGDTLGASAFVCLSAAAYMQLFSPDFASYMHAYRAAQDVRIDLHKKLDDDILECLDRGCVPGGVVV